MKKNKVVHVVLVVCCLALAFLYTNNTEEKTKEETKEKTVENYKTVVFKDDQDTLIPVEVNLEIEGEADQIYRNMLEVMKSSDFSDIGLYPIFSKDLNINNLDIKDHVLTMDFTNHFKIASNEDALDILEALAFTFCNDDITTINLLIDGEMVSTLPDSTIPVTCLTNELGLNNFESSTLNIYKTIPVTVYNTKKIQDNDYFVPTTKRIEAGKEDINTQVMLVLDEINCSQTLELIEEVAMYEGNLSVNLSSSILLDNETIDESLHQQLLYSLSSIQGVDEVSLLVDGQELETTVSKTIHNRVKL